MGGVADVGATQAEPSVPHGGVADVGEANDNGAMWGWAF
jgi:hypothetical protein